MYDVVLCPQREWTIRPENLNAVPKVVALRFIWCATFAFVCKFTQIISPAIEYLKNNAEKIVLQVFLVLWYGFLLLDENLLGFSVLRADDVHSHCHC